MSINFNKSDLYEQRLVEFISQTVCGFYRVPIDHISRKTKKQEIIKCKHMIIYLSMNYLTTPLQRIADLTGYNGDHSVMIYVKKKIDGYLSWDKKLKTEVKQLMNHIEASLFDQNKQKIEDIDFISLNNVTALRERPDRAIILVGYSPAEIEQLKLLLGNNNTSITFENTGLYLFNEKTNNNEKK